MGSSAFDAENQICEGQSFTGTPTVSEHSYAKVSAKQDLSFGKCKVGIYVNFLETGAGTTHTLEAIQADDGALTSNVTSLAQIVVPAAQAVPGRWFFIPIPIGTMNQRYIGLRHSATGGTTTAKIDAYFGVENEIGAPFKPFPKVVDVDV